MFKYVTEYVYIHIGFVIVIAECFGASVQNGVVNSYIVKHFIWQKQAAIISKDFVPFSYITYIKIAKVFLETVVQRNIVIQIFQLLPLAQYFSYRIGWQQQPVFGKKNEQKTVY